MHGVLTVIVLQNLMMIEESEYMERFEDKEVEVEGGVIFDEPNANVEEQNEEPEVNDADLDDEQKQPLRKLRRLNRKRKSKRTKLKPNYDLYDGVFKLKEVQLEYEKNSDAFMIKTLNHKHTCSRINKNRHANSAWLSKRYTKELRLGGNFKMSDFLGQVGKDFVVQPSRTQVYKAKLKAGEIIEGSLSTQYSKLWDYAEELKKTNPRSTVVIDTELMPDDKTKFKRIYICFNACKQGSRISLPYQHAIAAIYSAHEDLMKYVDICYHKESQMKCYDDVMYGINMEKYWTKTGRPPLVPPRIVKQPGRPKKLRIKEIGEIPPS
ncbi:hypothetical protein LWI28_009981 [Acer negundo]|uniref:Uncharacterized protein n=1 Tax=Acer negundo TaxID=4023 RepID=A0AAD5NUN4_ACENE|nr:hypothetical protein LWI28_009981 [Acer negundo]